MNKAQFGLTLFCTTFIWISPTFTTETKDVTGFTAPSLTKSGNSKALLADLALLEDFDTLNKQGEQQLRAVLDQEDEDDRQLQQALTQSIITSDHERSLRIDGYVQDLLKSVGQEVANLKVQLASKNKEVEDLSLLVYQAYKAPFILANANMDKDPAIEEWNKISPSYIAAQEDQKELIAKLEERRKFFTLLSSRGNLKKDENVVIALPKSDPTDVREREEPVVVPVAVPSILPPIHSSALRITPFSPSEFPSTPQDKK